MNLRELKLQTRVKVGNLDIKEQVKRLSHAGVNLGAPNDISRLIRFEKLDKKERELELVSVTLPYLGLSSGGEYPFETTYEDVCYVEQSG